MKGFKLLFLSVFLCVPTMSFASDYCTNPDEYTIDRRCYVTAEQKKEKPYKAAVALIKKTYGRHADVFTDIYCSGTIVKRQGLTSTDTGYFVYTAKHCVSDNGDNLRNQIQIQTPSGQEFTAELVKYGDYNESDVLTYHGDWAVFRILPNDTQLRSIYSVGNELGDAYVKINGTVGKTYHDARVIGYGALEIVSDAQLTDFRDKYVKFLEENDINISVVDNEQLNSYGLNGSGVVLHPEHNKWILKFEKAMDWDIFSTVKDQGLKVSYCSYSDNIGDDDNMNNCQSWGGNSGGGIFDENGNLIGILTRGHYEVGDKNTHARASGNIDFKKFGKLDREQK